MHRMKKVSIISPVFNGAKFLPLFIKNLSEYTFQDFEVIFVDNNSSDDSLQILQTELSKTTLDFRIFSETNQGSGYTRNTGLKNAKGKYVIFIDCDDDSGNGTYSMLEFTGLTPGETLYIRVWEYGNATSTIQFEVSAYDASLANESFTNNSVMIYPNPSNGLLSINSSEAIKVEAWDVLGKSVLNSDLEAGINRIDISNHAAGIYIFKITSSNGETNIYKVIKE